MWITGQRHSDRVLRTGQLCRTRTTGEAISDDCLALQIAVLVTDDVVRMGQLSEQRVPAAPAGVQEDRTLIRSVAR